MRWASQIDYGVRLPLKQTSALSAQPNEREVGLVNEEAHLSLQIKLYASRLNVSEPIAVQRFLKNE
jgi:hypothetical protein